MKNLIISNLHWNVFMYIIFLVGVFYSCASDEINTLGSIRGKIVSSSNDEPLQGANVTLSPGSYSTITGTDGSFEFIDLTPKQYSLQAQKSDHKSNYKQITVIAGQVASGDLSLIPLQTTSFVKVSPTELDFGSLQTDMIFNIKNTGNTGAIEWSISGIDVKWLQVNPIKGTTGQSMDSNIKVTVNRSFLLEKSSTYFTVNIPGGSISIHVIAYPANN